MPADTLRCHGFRQHYRPSRLRLPGWMRQLWLWF